MAIDQYLKVAAGQLRRAAETVKKETDDMRRQMDTYEKERRDHIASLKKQQQIRKTELNPNLDDVVRANALKEIALLEKGISEAEKDINDYRQQMSQQISNTGLDYNNLISKANELERMA